MGKSSGILRGGKMQSNIDHIRKRTTRLVKRSVDVDGYLPDSMVPELYEKWDTAWGDPIVHSGGALSITCDMIKEVPFSELSKRYGIKKAKVILQAAQRETW